MARERGELRDVELFSARIGAQLHRGECLADGVRFGQRAQIIDQRFAFFCEAQFYKIEKYFFI